MTGSTPEVTIVAALGSLASRTRLVKFARLYSAAGLAVRHAAWERQGDQPKPSPVELELGVRRQTITRGGIYGGTSSRRLILGYGRWAIGVFLYLLRRSAQDVHALGLESALPAILAAKFRQHRVVYDDADRFSLCHPMPGLIKRIVAAVERWVARNAHAHIVPGVGRYADGMPSANTIELPNWPSAQDVDAARSIGLPKVPDANFTLYANGWIGDRRGAIQLLRLAKALQGDDRFHLVVAGRLTEEAAQKLVTLSNVTNLGGLSQAEALAVYPGVDAVVTMYDPSIEINRYAEPNKWGDCLELGVPILVNREVKTAEHIVASGFALTFAWEDGPGGLTDLVHGLLADRGPLDKARSAIAAADFSAHSFDDTVRNRLIPVFAS